MTKALALSRLAATAFRASPFYRWALERDPPQSLVFAPRDPWPGDAAEANSIFQGRYHFGAEELRAPGQPPWSPTGMGHAFLAELHGLAWIRHFAAEGGEAARRHARGLVLSWLGQNQGWSGVAAEPAVAARRLMAFVGHVEFLTTDADAAFVSALLAGIGSHAKHLRWSADLAPPGEARIAVAAGLILASVALPDGAAAARAGERLLAREIAAQILPDGSHVSRQPVIHLAVLRDLVVAREALLSASREVPEALRNAIDRLAPAVRFFRHGDGGLALFQGGREDSAFAVAFVLDKAEAGGKPPQSLPHGGFERLAAKRAVMLVDCGVCGPGVLSHAAPLSFELSIGRQRVFVNCGGAEKEGELSRLLRGGAAHNVLTVAETSALVLDAAGRVGQSAPVVTAIRSEASGSVWLEASQDGFRAPFGLMHHRRLYLDAAGDDIRGEDRLVGHAEARPFAIRFHLHPGVHASLTGDGKAVLLRLDGGAGYRFRAAGATMTLEESLYLGQGPVPRRTEQIVLSGVTEPEQTTVKWALRKEA